MPHCLSSMPRFFAILLFMPWLPSTITAVYSSRPSSFQQYMNDWMRHMAACNAVAGTSPTSVSQFRLPLDWQADAEVTQVVDGKIQGSPFGIDFNAYTISQEASRQRMVQQTFTKFRVAPAAWAGTPKEWLNSTTYVENAFMGFAINGNKVPFDNAGGGAFHDMFAWLSKAHYGGKDLFKGQGVNRWLLSYSAPGANTSFELLVNAMDKPLHFWQNSSFTYMGKRRSFHMGYNFLSFYPNKTQGDVWAGFNKTEFYHPLVCPQPTTTSDPINKTMYIFHPAHQFDIAGQDLGDATGDTVFVCLDVITNQSEMTDHNYAWMTKWEIELVPKWGQYQNCNGYDPPQCSSEEHFLVGHEAAYYMGAPSIAERQCGSNPLVGEWYSLPVGGECKDGSRPGDGSCTWRKTRVKTIDGQCLIQGHGFRSTCAREQRAPYPQSKEVFLKAFASNDPSEGGCPEISAVSFPAPLVLV